MDNNATLQKLIDSVTKTPAPTLPDPSLKISIVEGLLKIVGEIKERDYHYRGKEGYQERIRPVSIEINLSHYESIYVESGRVFGVLKCQVEAIDSKYDCLGWATTEDKKTLTELCIGYGKVLKKKEIAIHLMSANPFFKKEELVAQVEEMYAALESIG